MLDDETGAEPKIISASFADPFLLLIRDDASIFVAQCDDDNDLEEIERVDDVLLSTKWLTGCLYDDCSGAFSDGKSNKAGENVKVFLLSAGGALHVSFFPAFHGPISNTFRFTHCLIFLSQFMLRKEYVLFLLCFQQIMQLGNRQLGKL